MSTVWILVVSSTSVHIFPVHFFVDAQLITSITATQYVEQAISNLHWFMNVH